ncbi:glycosyltransferase [Hymenobacter sp. BT175]|uniref:glycosyltransferase n=1 Tax=Hymenobacter translucens TaxID=2886507 RepID=UPI001D0E7780|nr:glycosyltransferase [Hymenobacter translucens]MCC2545368.1 glycosyltransferase [Hymenobacter translucens]
MSSFFALLFALDISWPLLGKVLLGGYFGLWLAGLLLALGLFLSRKRPAPVPLDRPLPRVSILIAARNEETAIGRCLLAIRSLSYPPELVEVLLGNDASTDQTRAVAEQAMQGYAGSFRCLTITENLGQARGKANVLAHLAWEATTEYFLITDADIAVPPGWVEAMVSYATGPVGTVTGLTLVRGPRLLDQLQGMDWLFSLGLVQVVADRSVPVTAMGNNMLVTRAAYEATGGYEQLPFSIVEDYALFVATVAQGFSFRNVFRPEVLAFSLPVPSVPRLLQQRRRWLRGVEGLPGWLKATLLFYGLFYAALLPLAFLMGIEVAVGVWAAKMVLQGLMVWFCFRRAGQPAPWWLMPAFELYSLGLGTALAVYRLLPLEFEWKGRRYR